MSSVAFRLTVYQANGTTPDFTVSSIRGGTNPYIVGVPSGDGQEVDLLTGAVRTGAYNVAVADVATGTDGTGTIRIITNKLEDASFRQQLLSRRAKIEISRNNGSTWAVWTFGYLTSLRQVDAITYNFTVSDSRRIESTHTAFTWSADTSSTTDERREFPNRGCLIGGPTLQNFGPLRASGGWEYAWKEVQSGYLALAFVAAYNAPSYSRTNTMNRLGFFNALRPFFQSLPPVANLTGSNFDQIRDRQYVFAFPKVMAVVTSGSSVWYGTVRAAHTPPAPGQNGQGMLESPSFGEMNYLYIELDPGQSTSYPTANTTVRVQLLQKEVSASSPLYINEHPVDIVTKLYETVNIPFNASSATAIKAVVGDDIRLALRITEPVRMEDFLSQSIFGPFGFAARVNASGEQEFFATRIANSATPTISITDDDVVGDAPPPIFEVDEASVVTSFRLTAKSLSPFVPDPTGTLQAPPDGLVEIETSEIVQNGDTSTYSTREVAYKFPGMVHDGSVTGQSFTLSPEVVGRFFTSIVAEGFDRFGRGAVASEVQVLSGATASSLQVGDEVLLDVGYYPNKNYRIGESTVGSRIAQIVRRTETPEGPVFKLIDSGVNAQPTSPTFTLATFAGDPRRVAAVTVTNAATLNSSNVTLAVQYQVSASTPTKTGTLYTRFRPGTIPTVAFTLPQVPPGSTVWVRMRTERTEYRASAWTSWTSVALDAWIPPVSLTAGTTTANSVALSWDLGSPTDNTIDPIDVFAYKGASAPADWTGYRVGSLSNGSTSITVRDLDASTQYTFGVAFKDEASGAYSTFATATATTNAVNTVAAPNAPKMKVYTSFPDAGTTTGVALAIGAVEGYNIVVERAPDSGGSPGAYKEIALLPPLTPIFVDPLPSDGLTRWYRVFYRLSGFLDGAKGTARSATPIAIPDDLVGQNASLISGGATLTFGAYLVGTPDSFYDGATSQSLAVDATDAATANKVVARDNTGSFSANVVTATLDGPAPAGQLTGTTLASNVVTSSLTSVGTIGTGVWQGTSVGKNYGGTGLTSTAFAGITNERVFAYDGASGSFFVAPSGSNGQALVYSGGALSWGNPAPAAHVLATTTALGPDHTVSGLTTGMILQATGATTARFQTPSIPASSVTAGTFSGASYTITNDLTVSGTLTASLPWSSITSTPTTLSGYGITDGVSTGGSYANPSWITSLAWSKITGTPTTIAGYGITDAVSTSGSYANPSWITSLAGSKISGNISGNAANVTGTVAIANGGTNQTAYATTGTGTRVLVYDQGLGKFDVQPPGTAGQFLKSSGTAGDVVWDTPPNFSTTTTAGGYAPGSNGVGTSYFLRADGTWANPSGSVTISAANVTAGTFPGALYTFTDSVNVSGDLKVDTSTLYVDSTNNLVAIGTATPLTTNGKLVMAVDGAANGIAFYDGTGTTFRLYRDADVACIGRAATAAIAINTSNQVGIGTTSPSALLTLAASNNGITNGTSNNILRFVDTDTSTANGQGLGEIEFYTSDTSTPGARVTTAIRAFAQGTSGGGALAFDVSANAGTAEELVRFNATGVGIGTSSPLNKLHIEGASGIRVSDATGSNFRGITFGATGGDATEYSYIKWQPNSGEFRLYANTAGFGGFMSFYSNNAEAMRITSSGDVGIGTTSPGYKLDVVGDGRITGNAYFGTHDGSDKYYFERFGAGLNAYLTSGSADNNASQGFIFQARNASGVEYNTVVFEGSSGTGTSPALYLDGSGNLGLGVTPSAWSGVTAFQIGAQGAITSTSNLMQMRSNAYFDGSVDRYIDSTTATDYYQNAGAHVWRTAVSGTAGDPITFTQAMTLNASGQLGIGTTSPATALDVVGTGQFSGDLLPATDNTGVVGSSARTWSNGQFTNLTVDSTLNVRAALDLADNDVLRLGSGDDWEFFHNGTANYMDLNVGNLIIRDNTTTRFTFSRTAGTITAADFILSSDRRKKAELEVIEDALTKVKALVGYTYRPIDGDRRRAGLMAQDVEVVAPEPVYTDDEGWKSLSYEQMIPYLVEAIKALDKKIEALV